MTITTKPQSLFIQLHGSPNSWSCLKALCQPLQPPLLPSPSYSAPETLASSPPGKTHSYSRDLSTCPSSAPKSSHTWLLPSLRAQLKHHLREAFSNPQSKVAFPGTLHHCTIIFWGEYLYSIQGLRHKVYKVTLTIFPLFIAHLPSCHNRQSKRLLN